MKTSYKGASLRILTVLLLLSLPLLGSSCEDVINQLNPPTGDIAGNWSLIYSEGTRDICPGETVTYPNATGGTAVLKCPEGSEISRNYTVAVVNSTNVLTYTDSGVEYGVSFTSNNELVLTGINNNRILYYSSQISDRKMDTPNADKNTSNNNSSELK